MVILVQLTAYATLFHCSPLARKPLFLPLRTSCSFINPIINAICTMPFPLCLCCAGCPPTALRETLPSPHHSTSCWSHRTAKMSPTFCVVAVQAALMATIPPLSVQALFVPCSVLSPTSCCYYRTVPAAYVPVLFCPCCAGCPHGHDP